MKINAIITGTTGMVGEGVLKEALLNPNIENILVINRRPCKVTHPRLTEILYSDFFNLTPLSEKLKGYNACFFCLGVSSVGMKEDLYYSLTYILTMHVAELLSRLNPEMTFCYVSGAGTDSTESGKLNWARVKGKTENALMKLPFKGVYAFRPGFIEPLKDAKNVKPVYKALFFLIPLVRFFAPKAVLSLSEIGRAMINVSISGYEKHILEIQDIKILAKR